MPKLNHAKNNPDTKKKRKNNVMSRHLIKVCDVDIKICKNYRRYLILTLLCDFLIKP